MPTWIKRRRSDGSIGAPEGPLKTAELLRMAESGYLKGDDQLGKSPGGPWVAASTVAVLQDSLRIGARPGSGADMGAASEPPDMFSSATTRATGSGSGGGGPPRGPAMSNPAEPEEDPEDGSDSTSLLLLPASIVRLFMNFLVRIAGGLFKRLSRAIGDRGHLGLLAGALSGIVVVLVTAVREDALSIALLAAVIPVLAALGQFMAHEFTVMGERVVRNTPSRSSSLVLYQFLGMLMVLGAIGCVLVGAYLLIKFGFRLEWLAILMLGVIPLTLGLLLLDATSTLNLVHDRACTAGEDGLSLISILLKASMAGARLIFGVSAICGGLVLIFGTAMVLYYGQSFEALRGYLLVTAGGYVLLQAVLFPFVTYLTSIIYFIFVDVLIAVLKRGRLVS